MKDFFSLKQTSSLSPGSYNLYFQTYDSYTNEIFYDSLSLTYRTQKFSTFIYTDKGIYKPEDTVNFAIFCVDSETRSYNPSGGSVTIYDSQNIKIKTIANVSFVGGKYEGSLVLSDLAAEGKWRLSFEAEQQVTCCVNTK
jgi:uncharacterized protein YfaS (alpha-2-macroglobulin family)